MNLLLPLTSFISTIKAVPNCGFSDTFLIKEPINTVSNLFYFMAGFRLLQEYRHHNIKHPYIKLLILLSFATGVGSTIHHAIPTDFTLFIDGVPIYLILSIIIFLFAQLIFSLSFRLSLFIAVLYAVVLALASPYLPIETIPAMKFYLVHTIVFIPLILVSCVKSGQTAFQLVTSLGLFWIGMYFFFLDKPICNFSPMGTHMLWHMFSSLSFYFLTRFFIEYYKFKQSNYLPTYKHGLTGAELNIKV